MELINYANSAGKKYTFIFLWLILQSIQIDGNL